MTTLKLSSTDLFITGEFNITHYSGKLKRKVIFNTDPHKYYLTKNHQIVSNLTERSISITNLECVNTSGRRTVVYNSGGLMKQEIVNFLLEASSKILPVHILTNFFNISSLLVYIIKYEISEYMFDMVPSASIKNIRRKPKIKIWLVKNNSNNCTVNVSNLQDFYHTFPNKNFKVNKSHCYLKDDEHKGIEVKKNDYSELITIDLSFFKNDEIYTLNKCLTNAYNNK